MERTVMRGWPCAAGPAGKYAPAAPIGRDRAPPRRHC